MGKAERAYKEKLKTKIDKLSTCKGVTDYYPHAFQQHLREFIEKRTQLIGEEPYLLKPRFPRQYLDNIPKDEHVLFCTCLALTVLLDQTMFTHFAVVYPVFKKQMEPILKVKYGLTWVHAKPWVLLIRKPSEGQFRDCVRTFLTHAKNIFSTSGMPVWAEVQQCINDDPDVRKTVFGEWFCSELNTMKN